MDLDPEDFNPHKKKDESRGEDQGAGQGADNTDTAERVKKVVPLDELLATTGSRLVLGFLLFCGFLVGVWVAGVALHDPDTCWLLALGRYIVQNHQLPTTDPFSWTFAAQAAQGQHFILYQWLSEVLFYLATLPAGLVTLLLLCAVTISTAFLSIPMSFVVRREAPFVKSALVVILGMLSASFHTLARPEIFSYLFTALFLQVVHNARAATLSGEKKTFPLVLVLAPLMVLWANMHTGFISGMGILGALGLGSLLALIFFKAPVKNLFVSALIALLGCAVAALINPYGFGLYAYIPQLFNMPVNKYIIELQPVFGPGVMPTPDLYPFLLLCFVYLFLLAREGLAFVRPPRPFTVERKLLACELLICLIAGQVGIYNALVHRRVASFVTLILVAEIIALLSLGKARREERAGESPAVKNRFWTLLDSHSLDLWRAGGIYEMAIIALCALAGVTLVSFRIARPELPASSNVFQAPFAAVEYIGKNQPPGKLYNDQQFGDLLVYYLPGKPKVFVDTRFDMYGSRLVEDYRLIHECEPGWQKLLAQYDVDWVFLLPDSLLAEQLKKDSSWKCLYKDKYSLILARQK